MSASFSLSKEPGDLFTGRRAARLRGDAARPAFARPPAQSPSEANVLRRKASCACGGGCPSCEAALPLQARLEVSQPGDAYEQEADSVAEQVMRMPAPEAPQTAQGLSRGGVSLQRKCACGGGGACPSCAQEPEGVKVQRSSAGQPATRPVPGVIHDVLGSGGRPLGDEVRSFMEPRFGQDFGHVRIHSDERAAQSASAVSALAYTVGNNIVFGANQFAPDTAAGKRLLAHELAHVVQQQSQAGPAVIQRYPSCTAAQDTSIAADHARALDMLRTAIRKISSYDGTNPAEVHAALARHFNGSTSNAFATWINVNLRFLLLSASDPYECYTGGALESTWACGSNQLATTFWCVPGVNIRLCPSYFGQSATERSTTLIHEWVHKYGCNFDLGYEHEAEYGSNSTVAQLANADSFSSLVRDVQ